MLYMYKMYNMTKLADHIELAGMVTVGPKGQVVIPADIRDKMQALPGTKLVALYLPHKQAVAFVTEKQMQTVIDQMGQHVEALRNLTNSQG